MKATSMKPNLTLPFGPRGFTAVEMLVVLTIAGILTVTAVPNFAAALERYRVDGVTHDLQHAFMKARAQALSTGHRVVVAPLANNDWVNGWRVFVDPNNNGALDADERVLQVFEPRGLALTMVPTERLFEAGETRVSFTAYGAPRALNGTTFADGAIAVRLGSTARTVCLDVQGRTHVIDLGAC